LDDALSLVRPGGLSIVDDLLPQPLLARRIRPPEFQPFLNALEQHLEFHVDRLARSTGLFMADYSKCREKFPNGACLSRTNPDHLQLANSSE
jgi:hypothetical protein